MYFGVKLVFNMCNLPCEYIQVIVNVFSLYICGIKNAMKQEIRLISFVFVK